MPKPGILGIDPSEASCEDPLCPFHGNLSVRGIIINGRVTTVKRKNVVTVLKEYLHYVSKYERYERRRKKISARCPPCIKVNEGDEVIIGECRPLSRSISFVVLSKVGKKS